MLWNLASLCSARPDPKRDKVPIGIVLIVVTASIRTFVHPINVWIVTELLRLESRSGLISRIGPVVLFVES